MRELKGLEIFLEDYKGMIKAEAVADFMQKQFIESHLRVYADALDESQENVLADLTIQESSYDAFSQSLSWHFSGKVLQEAIPLTYCIKGKQLQFTGRCSVIPKVCGVDLYFSDYQKKQDFLVRQKIHVSIKDLIKQLKRMQALDNG